MGVQIVVADHASRILLVRHGYRPGWHLPGGGVERRESLLSAITRELDEEAGVKLEEAPQLFGLYTHFDAFPGDHIALFIARRWQQIRIPAPNTEIAEQAFFEIRQLPEAITDQTRNRLGEIFGGRSRTRTW